MRVLIIKTSSMGDIIHTLPALTDAGNAIPDIQFDWVVEENFAEIPHWHPRVNQVIPVALRRWRKNLFSEQTRAEWKECYAKLRATKYDLIIDAQGLLKSAWLVWMARGERCGLNWECAREPMASLFYQRKVKAGKIKEVHAVTRMRSLFSEALRYEMPESVADYGLNRQQFAPSQATDDYLVFLHGTTWPTKHWPEDYWMQLAKISSQEGLNVKLLWGNQAEQERAERIAATCERVEVLPRMQLFGVAQLLAGAKAVVAMDTGLGHLAAALDVPTVSLYGPSNPVLTGAIGKSQKHLSAKYPCSPCLSSECLYRQEASLNSVIPPCFSTLPPDLVWKAVNAML
ncbi:MAG: lipopolysaccharide heptosyltransferase I [Gammaproteobacteria bacterium]